MVRISIPVISKNDDETHQLGIEFEDDVAVIFLDNEEICKTDVYNIVELLKELIIILSI